MTVRHSNGTRPRKAGLRSLVPGAAIAFIVFAAGVRPVPAPDASPASPPTVRAGYDRIANELLCYCGCARQTIKECTCGIAFDLRDEFEKRLAKGETADSIIAAYIAEHGEQSRNVPPKKGLNLLAWFGPAAIILIAAGATIVLILIWTSRGRKAAAAAPPAPAAPEDPLRKRLEEELRGYEL